MHSAEMFEHTSYIYMTLSSTHIVMICNTSLPTHFISLYIYYGRQIKSVDYKMLLFFINEGKLLIVYMDIHTFLTLSGTQVPNIREALPRKGDLE